MIDIITQQLQFRMQINPQKIAINKPEGSGSLKLHQLFLSSSIDNQPHVSAIQKAGFTPGTPISKVNLGIFDDQLIQNKSIMVEISGKMRQKGSQSVYKSFDNNNEERNEDLFVTNAQSNQQQPPKKDRDIFAKKNHRIKLKRQVVSSMSNDEQKPDIFNTTKGKLYQIPLNSKTKRDKFRGNMISLIKVPDMKEGACQNQTTHFNSFYELENYLVNLKDEAKEVEEKKKREAEGKKKYSVMPALRPPAFKQKVNFVKSDSPSAFATLHEYVLNKKDQKETVLIVESKKQKVLQKITPKKEKHHKKYKSLRQNQEPNLSLQTQSKKSGIIGNLEKGIISQNYCAPEERQKKTLSPLKIPQKDKKARKVPFMMESGLEKGVYSSKIDSYRQFLFIINLAHRVFNPLNIVQSICLPKSEKDLISKYYYYVGPGNNSMLIKSLMRKRIWWHQTKNVNEAHFVWTQIKVEGIFDGQGSFEGLESKSSLRQLEEFFRLGDNDRTPKLEEKKRKSLKNLFSVEKYNLVSSQTTKLENISKNLNPRGLMFKAPFDVKDEQKILTDTYSKVYKNMIKKISKVSSDIDNFEGRLKYLPKDFLTRTSEEQKYQVHNHLQGGHSLGNKKALLHHMLLYYKLTGKSAERAFPVTYHIRTGQTDSSYNEFIKEYRRISREKPALKNIWILKPGQNSNRGSGITVIKDLREINKRLNIKEKHSNGELKTYILQKYIEKPLLFKNRKFDIRHYMVITALHGRLRAYFYSEGYVRTSSCEFNLSNVRDKMVHLTNDAVQKQSEDYGCFQDCNKVSYNELQKYYTKYYPEKQFDLSQIYIKMRKLARDAICATYLSLDVNKKLHNFQIFGLDFMIDEQLKVNLIEVNTNPCLELDSAMLQRVIPPMLDQAFRVGLDPIFPPPLHFTNNTRYLAPDCSLQKFQYELIFDETRDGAALRELFNNNREEYEEMLGYLVGSQKEVDDVFDNEGEEIDMDKLI